MVPLTSWLVRCVTKTPANLETQLPLCRVRVVVLCLAVLTSVCRLQLLISSVALSPSCVLLQQLEDCAAASSAHLANTPGPSRPSHLPSLAAAPQALQASDSLVRSIHSLLYFSHRSLGVFKQRAVVFNHPDVIDRTAVSFANRIDQGSTTRQRKPLRERLPQETSTSTVKPFRGNTAPHEPRLLARACKSVSSRRFKQCRL